MENEAKNEKEIFNTVMAERIRELLARYASVWESSEREDIHSGECKCS